MCLLYNKFFFVLNILNMFYEYISNNKNRKLHDSDDDDIDKIIENISKNKEILINEHNELLLLENKDDENIIIEKYNEYMTDNDDFVYVQK